MAFEIVALLSSYFLSLVGHIPLCWSLRSQKKATPILLLPGYLNSGWVLAYHAWLLQKAGFGPIWALHLGLPFRSIETYAKKVAKRVEELGAQPEPWTLIGHSMGGLVAAYYALELAKRGSIAKVITLGSPLHGTERASWGLGKCAKEMRRNSPLVTSLSQKILEEKEIQFYQMVSKDDWMIRPSSSSLVGNVPERQYLLEGNGHASLLYSRKVNEKLCEWLGK